MSSVLLYPGSANPNDVTLRDAGIALAAIATTGVGTTAITVVNVGIEATTESGSGADAVTLRKVGVVAAATSGPGNAAVVLVDSESVSVIMAGQSIVAAQLASVGLLALETGAASSDDVTLDLVFAAPDAKGGPRYFTPIAPLRLKKALRPTAKKPRRRPRVLAFEIGTQGGESALDVAVARIGALTVSSADASDTQMALDIDPLLNDERTLALALLTDLLAA